MIVVGCVQCPYPERCNVAAALRGSRAVHDAALVQLAADALHGCSHVMPPAELLPAIARVTALTVPIEQPLLVLDAVAFLYSSGGTPERRGLAIARGTAHCLLERAIGFHTSADALILSAELLAPREVVEGLGLPWARRAQRSVPGWFLDVSWPRGRFHLTALPPDRNLGACEPSTSTN